MDKRKNVYEMNFDYILWDEKLWKKYLKKLKRVHRKFESDRMGQIRLWDDKQDSNEYQMQVVAKSVLSELLDGYMPIHPDIPDKKQICILPLDEEPESSTYLFYSTRLAILQTDEQASKWLLQYFMDLRLFYHENYINFLFLEEEIEQVLDLTPISYLDVENFGGILEFIRSNVLSGRYVNVHLDEFYLPVKEYYWIRHYVHENLIYGFNDEAQEIYMYGIAERQQTKVFTVSYKDFLTAYEKGKLFSFCGAGYLEQEGYAPVLLCQIGTIPEYQFSWTEMRKKLEAFMRPKPEEMVGEDIHVYGTDIYAWILRELMGETEYGIDDFRVFQLLYEQKRCVYRRMQYLQERNLFPENMSGVLSEYEDLILDFQGIRMVYLKQLQKEGAWNDPVKRITDQETRCKLAGAIKEAVHRERIILEKLL